jgi:4-hydroxy-tetrahydrodipicolinate synthase
MTDAIGRPTVVAAFPTPFDESEELNVPAIGEFARHLIDSGCDALFVGGTTGEFPALTTAERVLLIKSCVEAVGPEHVMAHVGTACARDSESLAAQVVSLGVRDIAAATPYFLPADTDRMFEYFQRISRAMGDARLWLYVFPERTGNAINPDLVARLLDLPNVYGAKVSSPGLAPIANFRALTKGRLRIFSGGDPDLLEAFSVGASGLVSGNCAVVPAAYVAFADAVERNDPAEMDLRQEEIRTIARAIGGDVGGVKAALHAIGRPMGHPRMAVTDAVSDSLASFVQGLRSGPEGRLATVAAQPRRPTG